RRRMRTTATAARPIRTAVMSQLNEPSAPTAWAGGAVTGGVSDRTAIVMRDRSPGSPLRIHAAQKRGEVRPPPAFAPAFSSEPGPRSEEAPVGPLRTLS